MNNTNSTDRGKYTLHYVPLCFELSTEILSLWQAVTLDKQNRFWNFVVWNTGAVENIQNITKNVLSNRQKLRDAAKYEQAIQFCAFFWQYSYSDNTRETAVSTNTRTYAHKHLGTDLQIILYHVTFNFELLSHYHEIPTPIFTRTAIHRSVWSRNLVKEKAVARQGLLSQIKENKKPSWPGPSHNRGFTTTLSHTTLARTPLEEWSDRCSEIYLTTHNTHKIQTSMSQAGFEPLIPASERPQTHALDRVTTGIGLL